MGNASTTTTTATSRPASEHITSPNPALARKATPTTTTLTSTTDKTEKSSPTLAPASTTTMLRTPSLGPTVSTTTTTKNPPDLSLDHGQQQQQQNPPSPTSALQMTGAPTTPRPAPLQQQSSASSLLMDTLAGMMPRRMTSSTDMKARLALPRAPARFLEEYEEGEKLGEGITGTVRVVTHRRTLKKFAMKTINLNRVNKQQIKELRLEVNALKKLDHPNVVRLYETFEARDTIIMVMELYTGGELAKRRLSKESDVVNVVGQLLTAILHCHNQGIVHRDIKLENILFTAPESSRIVLIDFGLSGVDVVRATASKRLVQKRMLDTTCGTSFYIAPEVLDGKYDYKADLWSVGIVVYMLLTGRPPFDGPNEKAIFRKIRNGIVDFSAPVWGRISPHAETLVRNLLQGDPTKRWDAEQALQSPWFKSFHDSLKAEFETDVDIGHSVVTSLSNFVKYGRLKKAALMVIAHSKTHDELRELSAAFRAMDTDNSGEITIAELRDLLQKYGVMSETAVKVIFDGIDVDASGSIQYYEFLAATVEARCLVDRDAFVEAFDRIAGGKEFITRADLTKLLGQSTAQTRRIIAELDKNKDGVISLAEFLELYVDEHESEIVEEFEDAVSTSAVVNAVEAEAAPASASASSSAATAAAAAAPPTPRRGSHSQQQAAVPSASDPVAAS